MSGIALEGDEIRPTIQLSPEQIAELEAEKAALRGSALAGRKSDAVRIKGEGTALDPEPNVIAIRSRLAAQRREAGEPEEPVQEQPRAPLFTATGAITADPEEVAKLVRTAKETYAEYELAAGMAEQARETAMAARRALNAYLESSGLE